MQILCPVIPRPSKGSLPVSSACLRSEKYVANTRITVNQMQLQRRIHATSTRFEDTDLTRVLLIPWKSHVISEVISFHATSFSVNSGHVRPFLRREHSSSLRPSSLTWAAMSKSRTNTLDDAPPPAPLQIYGKCMSIRFLKISNCSWYLTSSMGRINSESFSYILLSWNIHPCVRRRHLAQWSVIIIITLFALDSHFEFIVRFFHSTSWTSFRSDENWHFQR